jgi:hypothetical protein
MKHVKILIVFLALCASLSAQDKSPAASNSQKSEPVKKAEQILQQAREAISKKIKIADVKSFTLGSKSSELLFVAGKKIEGTVEEEYNFVLPGKIRHNFAGNYSTNQSITTAVLDGEKFSSKIDTFVEGKLVNYNLGASINKKEQISQLKHDAFIAFFPITLDASVYLLTEFNYVGVAEAKDGKAFVIEAVAPSKAKYRLFFDAATHLLLMMTESWTNGENKPSENKYFFSDYRDRDGLLVANKIVTERNGEVVKEKEIKTLKINPDFKADFFEVKEK